MKKILGFVLLAAVIFLVASLGGWYSRRQSLVEIQRSLIAKIDALDGHYYYDFQLLEEGTEAERLADADDPAATVHWLSPLFGIDWFHDVFYVTFAEFDGVPEDGGKATARNEITDDQLGELIKLPSLRWVALNGTAVTDTGLALLAQSLKMERMWLGQTQLSDLGLKSLGACPSLTHLAIEATPTSDRGMVFLTMLPKLQSLSLGSPFITRDGLRTLQKLASLRELYLDRCPVDASVLNALGKLAALETLSLRATMADDRGLSALSGLQELRSIRLDGSLVTDDGLVVAQSWPKLRELSLAGNEFTDSGLEHLAACTELKSLNLAGTKCTLYGVSRLFVEQQGRSFASALQTVFDCELDDQGEVVSLDLTPLSIRDDDIELLRPLQQLQWLTLSNNVLTDAGLQALAGGGFSQLSLLKIDGANITDAGLQSLLKLDSLRDLHVTGTSVSPGVVDQIRRTRPSLTIYSGPLR